MGESEVTDSRVAEFEPDEYDLLPHEIDAMARRVRWAAEPRIAPGTRIATSAIKFAERCPGRMGSRRRRIACPSKTWVPKATEGHGRSKKTLQAPIPVCSMCGTLWPTEEAFEHVKAGGGPKPQGKWVRKGLKKGWFESECVYVGTPTRPSGGSTEEQIYGTVDVQEILKVQALADHFMRSKRYRWAARVYFAYVLRFHVVKGLGGERVLAQEAAKWWPTCPGYDAGCLDRKNHARDHADFPWNRARVEVLIDLGREQWGKRLVRAKRQEERERRERALGVIA